MCGLPPFVDEMIDVFIDDDIVYVGVPRLFTRPLRLTAPEGFALVAAGRAAMQLPGADPDGPLGRGLQKLARGARRRRRRGRHRADRRRSRRRSRRRRRARRAERLRIEYWTASRDEVTTREITPRRVFNDRGEWYVVADDGRSGERRTFRVDRMERIDPTGRARSGRDDGGPATPGSARLVRRRRSAPGDAAVAPRRRDGSSSGTRSTSRRAAGRRACGRRSRWPASAGWSGCSCGSAPMPRWSRRPTGAAWDPTPPAGCWPATPTEAPRLVDDRATARRCADERADHGGRGAGLGSRRRRVGGEHRVGRGRRRVGRRVPPGRAGRRHRRRIVHARGWGRTTATRCSSCSARRRASRRWPWPCASTGGCCATTSRSDVLARVRRRGQGRRHVAQLISHQCGLITVDGITLARRSTGTPSPAVGRRRSPSGRSGRPRLPRLTFGWLAGELVRRVDGRSLGTVRGRGDRRPLGVELWIGLPEERSRGCRRSSASSCRTTSTRP